jgi:protein-L-isoaspartate(D-aspartate) O-methyltransferase
VSGAPRPGANRFLAERRALVARVAREIASMPEAFGDAGLDPRIAQALESVPRHEFVPEDEQAHAWRNVALPIGYGQTISQPFVVAAMTQLMAVEPGDVVLEVGTGSGYQAALLAEIGARVQTIEIVEPLAKRAAATLASLGYRNVEVRCGDGHRGIPERAPFDAIIVTAAGNEVPPALFEQLRVGGRLVAPVDRGDDGQWLRVHRKRADSSIEVRDVLPVVFVPLTGGNEAD